MNSLLNEALLATKNIQNAAIIRQKDWFIKAKSPQFNISAFDIDRILKAFENPKETRLSEYGLSVLDLSYKAIRVDDLAIYAKNEKNGIIIAKTHSHLIVGTYDSTMYASVAAEAVEKLADYFRKKGK